MMMLQDKLMSSRSEGIQCKHWNGKRAHVGRDCGQSEYGIEKRDG